MGNTFKLVLEKLQCVPKQYFKGFQDSLKDVLKLV